MFNNNNDFDLNDLLADQVNSKTKTTKEKKESSPIVLESLDDLVGNIKKKQQKKTFGYYLDVEVDEELERYAIRTNNKKSEVLNTILRKLFFTSN